MAWPGQDLYLAESCEPKSQKWGVGGGEGVGLQVSLRLWECTLDTLWELPNLSVQEVSIE